MFQQRSSNTNGNVDAYSLAWKLMTYVPAQHRTVPEEGGKWFRNDDRNQTCVERCNPRTIQLTSPAPLRHGLGRCCKESNCVNDNCSGDFSTKAMMHTAHALSSLRHRVIIAKFVLCGYCRNSVRDGVETGEKW